MSLGLPYDKRSRQVQGRVTEKKIARERGARVHPMSGAGRIKEDASTDEDLYEIKDANKTFTLSAADLLQSFKRGAQQGKNSIWVVTFGNGIEAEIHLRRRTV